MLVEGLGFLIPEPREELENRSPKGVPIKYSVVVQGPKLGVLRGFRVSGFGTAAIWWLLKPQYGRALVIQTFYSVWDLAGILGP